jgi:regulator of protease activity HflC (stomatin/prohibitin superfamily)
MAKPIINAGFAPVDIARKNIDKFNPLDIIIDMDDVLYFVTNEKIVVPFEAKEYFDLLISIYPDITSNAFDDMLSNDLDSNVTYNSAYRSFLYNIKLLIMKRPKSNSIETTSDVDAINKNQNERGKKMSILKIMTKDEYDRISVSPLAIVIWLAIIIVALMLLFGSYATVPSGHVGIRTTMGKVDSKPLGEGIHFKMPITQDINIMSTRVEVLRLNASAAAKSSQDVFTKVATNYHINPDKAPFVYQKLGADYSNTIIDPIIHEVVKSVIAKYDARDLMANREKVKNTIQEILVARLAAFNIIVDDFSIIDFQFSSKYAQSIEINAVASTQYNTAEINYKTAEIKAKTKLMIAKNEAAALNAQKESVTPELIQLRQTENEAAAIQKWDGKLPSATGSTIPMINIPAK